MILYHGTSQKNLESIFSNGLVAPSYWGTLEQAQSFAESFGADGVILTCEFDASDLSASMLMAESLYESGDIDEMPDEDNLAFSLEHLGGVTCNEVVFDLAVV